MNKIFSVLQGLFDTISSIVGMVQGFFHSLLSVVQMFPTLISYLTGSLTSLPGILLVFATAVIIGSVVYFLINRDAGG